MLKATPKRYVLYAAATTRARRLRATVATKLNGPQMSLSKEIGRVLRRAREARGLTLRAVAEASKGRFPATSVAGYERGERAISLERFCNLAAVYRVTPQRLVAEVVRSATGRPRPTIDMTHLEQLDDREAEVVRDFIRQVASLRRIVPGESVSVREGDLEVLATVAGVREHALLEVLRPAIVLPPSDPEPTSHGDDVRRGRR